MRWSEKFPTSCWGRNEFVNKSKCKLLERWVPRLLAVDQKRVRTNISNALLAPINYCRWNLDASLYARNKNPVQTVDCKGETGSKISINLLKLKHVPSCSFTFVVSLDARRRLGAVCKNKNIVKDSPEFRLIKFHLAIKNRA